MGCFRGHRRITWRHRCIFDLGVFDSSVKQNSKALEQQNQFSAAQIMQARTDTVMEFNSVILMEHKNLEALGSANPKSSDLSAIDAVEASRYRMILTIPIHV